MEVIDNALSNTADSEANLEAELAVDTDAVTSAVPWEQRKIGALLSNEEGGPSPLFRVLQLVAAMVAFLTPIVRVDGYAARANMERPNELVYLSMLLLGSSSAMLLLALGSARVALQPGGPLERLGAGEQKISASDAKSLARWRAGLWAFSALWLILAPMYFAQAIIGKRFGQTGPGSVIPALERVFLLLLGLDFTTVFPIVFACWLPSMGTACCLCRDKAAEIIRNVRNTDVPNPAAAGDQTGSWDKDVVEPALALSESIETLSGGWGSGLLGTCGWLVLFALFNFVNAINYEWTSGVDAAQGDAPGTNRHIGLGGVVPLVLLALLLARDLASTTSRCDDLRAQLNHADIKHGAEHHQKIDWLFVTLQRLASQVAASSFSATRRR
eukprot:COSAG04_NODE_871_length_9717_cov_4.356831_8_plen_386_part_00